jgi:hypothetical protein
LMEKAPVPKGVSTALREMGAQPESAEVKEAVAEVPPWLLGCAKTPAATLPRS